MSSVLAFVFGLLVFSGFSLSGLFKSDSKKESPLNVAQVSKEDISDLEAKAVKDLNDAKPEESYSDYLKLIKLDPSDEDYYLKAGQLAFQLKKNDEAFKLYQEGLKINPKSEPLKVALAYFYLFNNDYLTSKSLFIEVLDQNKNDPNALTGLGFLEEVKGKDDEAEKYYNEALEQDPKNITALIYMGNLRMKDDKFDEAKKYYDEVKVIDPHNNDVDENLQTIAKKAPMTQEEIEEKEGKKLIQEEKLDEAIPIYESLVTGSPNNGEYYYQLATLYLYTDRLSEAIEFYKKALLLNPNRQEFRTGLARAYLLDDDIKRAQALFETVLKFDPDNSEALGGLGRISALRNEDDKAEKFYQASIASDEENTIPLYDYASLKLKQNNYAEADKLFNKLLELEPTNVEAKEGLSDIQVKQITLEARAYEEGKHPELALKVYENGLRKYPNNNKLKILLAYSYFYNNEINKSTALLMEVLKEKPNDPEALAGLAHIEDLNKHPARAEEMLRKALDLQPDNAAALEFMAIHKLDEKKYHESVRYYTELLKQDPDNPDYIRDYEYAFNKPVADRANYLYEHKNYAAAEALYQYLIARAPNVEAYYYLLGRVYIAQEQKDLAIETYLKGLELSPNEADLFRVLGFAYLYKAMDIDVLEGNYEFICNCPFVGWNFKENLYLSQLYFNKTLEFVPQDPDSLAGLGRIAAIYEQYDLAEEYYDLAQSIEPDNQVTIIFRASLRGRQRRPFSALELYEQAEYLNNSDDETVTGINEISFLTYPTFSLNGFYNEEKEFDHVLHHWDARLRDFGEELTINYPIDDEFSASLDAVRDTIILRDLENHNTIYAFKTISGRLNANWNYSPFINFYAGMGLYHYDQAFHPVFRAGSKNLVLPMLGGSYVKSRHTFTLETVSDAGLVSRNFNRDTSKILQRQTARGFYEYDFGLKRYFGCQAMNIWLSDHNQEQFSSAWIQVTPPVYWENALFKYQFDFARYNHLTTSYYTFQDQSTHWIKFEFNKQWLNKKLLTEAGFWHCWQRSFESGQIIALTPTTDYRFIHREINMGYGRINYKINDCIDLNIFGAYSRDTFKYTTWSVNATLHGRF